MANALHLTHGGRAVACARFESPVASAVQSSCFMGPQLWASTRGFPRPTRNRILRGPLGCVTDSLVDLTSSIHTHNLTQWYKLPLCFSMAISPSRSREVCLPSLDQLPVCGVFPSAVPLSAVTAPGVLTGLWSWPLTVGDVAASWSCHRGLRSGPRASE